jgi:hypothetical protein
MGNRGQDLPLRANNNLCAQSFWVAEVQARQSASTAFSVSCIRLASASYNVVEVNAKHSRNPQEGFQSWIAHFAFDVAHHLL